jgi:hypothetical protein
MGIWMSGIRYVKVGRKSEVGSRKTEVRRQKSEDGRRKSEVEECNDEIPHNGNGRRAT